MGGTVGRVVSVNISEGKGTSKKAVAEGRFRCDVGLVGDAHAGPGIRQVSLLAAESIARQQEVLESRRQEGKCPKAHGEDFNLLGEYAGAYEKAGFPNLLESASRGDLAALAGQARRLDEKVREWLTGRSIALNVLDDEEDLRRFLNQRDPA